MSLTWQPDIVLLGAGGNDPRVDFYSVDSGEIQKFMGLRPMHSAYTIDIESDTGTIATGTKGGLVYIAPWVPVQPSEKVDLFETLIQGAPILSLCWINQSLLAVSDTAGRCLLWQRDQNANPRPLEVKEGFICALLNIGRLGLVGLSTKGKLLFWDSSNDHLARVVDIPPTPSISALVRIFYWPAKQALVCPGSGGRLTLFDLDQGNVKELHGHNGELYAIAVGRENLFTAGMDDGQLKVWAAGSDKPISTFEVPAGVIAIATTGGPVPKILLVTAQGKAAAYTLEEGGLRHLRWLPGKDYRAVTAFPAEQMQTLQSALRLKEVRHISDEIMASFDQMPAHAIETLHSRLIELGYEHVSLALRAHQAEQKGDTVEGLKCYRNLLAILPQGHINNCPSMKKYAALLETVWHLQQAHAACKSIMEIDPDYQFTVKAENLAHTANLISNGHWVIEPDTSIETIIESATAISKKFLGRYMINKLSPELCVRTRLSPGAIVEKYNQIRSESFASTLPRAKEERVWWISRTGTDEIELVTFKDELTDRIKGLQFALQVLEGEANTALVPVVLFDWRDPNERVSFEIENRMASMMMTRIRNKDLSTPHLAAVHKALRHALQRLITERSPQREMEQ